MSASLPGTPSSAAGAQPAAEAEADRSACRVERSERAQRRSARVRSELESLEPGSVGIRFSADGRDLLAIPVVELDIEVAVVLTLAAVEQHDLHVERVEPGVSGQHHPA